MKPEHVEKVLEYCNGCLRFNAGKRQCHAFKDPFPLWTKKERLRHNNACFSRQESAEAYKKEMQDVLKYQMDVSPAALMDSRTQKKVEAEIKKADKIIAADVNEARSENQRTGFPWIYAMGGSSNKDGSQFGKESQKDNRMMHRKRDPKREDWN
jgi:hypothetical protein